MSAPKPLTEDQVLKTPYKVADAKEDDKVNGLALDWVVEWANKQEIQLVFIKIDEPLDISEEDKEYIHVYTLYDKKSKSD